MHQQWIEIAQQVEVSTDLIPEILASLGINDPELPSPARVEDFENVCVLVADGQPIQAAAQIVIEEAAQQMQPMDETPEDGPAVKGEDATAQAIAVIHQGLDADVEYIMQVLNQEGEADRQAIVKSVRSLRLNKLALRIAKEGLGGGEIEVAPQPAGSDFLAQLQALAALPPQSSVGALPESGDG